MKERVCKSTPRRMHLAHAYGSHVGAAAFAAGARHVPSMSAWRGVIRSRGRSQHSEVALRRKMQREGHPGEGGFGAGMDARVRR